MSTIYKYFLARDWGKKKNSFFSIPLCRTHGKEMKRCSKIGVGFFIIDTGKYHDIDCFFCGHPEGETLKKLLIIQKSR